MEAKKNKKGLPVPSACVIKFENTFLCLKIEKFSK